MTRARKRINLARSNLEWAGGLASYDGDIHGFFQKVFLCSPDIAASIGRRAHERRFPVDAVLLKQGDRAGATFLVVVGRAHALTYSIAGHKVLLREFLPGDFFGAIVAAEPQPEEADVVAVEEVRAAVFLTLDFLNLIETYGCVGLVVSQALLRQLRAASAKMLERSTLTAAGRVHAELLRRWRAWATGARSSPRRCCRRWPSVYRPRARRFRAPSASSRSAASSCAIAKRSSSSRRRDWRR